MNKMNKVRCHYCRKLVPLKSCPSVGYITTASGVEKIWKVECQECMDKSMLQLLKILKED